MKKSFLLVTLLLSMSLCGWAKQVSEQDALSVARNFSSGNSALRSLTNSSRSLELAYAAKAETNENLLYVFNRADESGYVVVAGDDVAAASVLGYADSGSFDYETMPENLKWWIGEYSREIEFMIKNSANPATAESSAMYSTAVSPLLGTTVWNQSSPYNDQCPTLTGTTHCATGCGATAMAQVMYYHKWPEQGTGSHSYTSATKNYKLSADFSATTYEWDNMLPSYTSSSSSESKSAVALLMSHCGISMDMDYNSQSGASTTSIAKALATYFKYDKSVIRRLRDYYPVLDWEARLKNELDAGRPVVYDGQADDGGHAFVLDGYNTDGYFHVNWGWGGMSNGYFKVTALTPASQGIGGASGGFNSRQGATMGIQKEVTGSIPQYEVYMGGSMYSNTSSVGRNGSVIVTSRTVQNGSWNDVTMKLRYELRNTAGDVVSTFSYNYGEDVTLNSYWNMPTVSSSITIPSSVANGQYRLYLCFKPSASSTWETVHYSCNNSGYMNVIVSNDAVTYSPQTINPDLDADINVKGSLITTRTSSISAVISNKGDEYYGMVKIVLLDPTSNAAVLTGEDVLIDVAKDDAVTAYFNDIIDVTPGNYYLAILNRNNNQIGNSIPVEVIDVPELYSLRLTKRPSFPNYNNVPQDDMSLTAIVENTGGQFNGSLSAYIAPVTGGNTLGIIQRQDVVIEKNETKTIVFNGSFDDGVVGNSYMAMVFNDTASGWLSPTSYFRTFTLGAPTAVSTIKMVESSVYPNPATDVVNVKSASPIKRISIYATSGALAADKSFDSLEIAQISVEGLSAGQYIMMVVTEDGNSIQQIIKK